MTQFASALSTPFRPPVRLASAGNHVDGSLGWPALVVLGLVVVLAALVSLAHLTHRRQEPRGLAARHGRAGESAPATTADGEATPPAGPADADADDRSPPTTADSATPLRDAAAERNQPLQ